MTSTLTARQQMLLFLLSGIVYLAGSYAGVRSPDSEVVFETCDALLHRHSFNVVGQSTWPDFGLAPGRDGGSYAIFGPLQPLACVPFLAAADALDRTRWFQGVALPRSHYIDGGSRAVLTAAPIEPAAAKMHARRTLVAWSFNALVGAAAVLAFARLCSRLARHRTSALLTTAGFALGSLLWPYSGTFFSEPLAILFLILSCDALLSCVGAFGDDAGPGRGRVARAVWSGAALGLATAAHVTAILFLPFWLAIAFGVGARRARVTAGSGVLAGALVPLALLAIYDYGRFGSIWETGRSFEPERFGYGVLQAPWRGLWGLSLSPGKGLVLFCPVILLGLPGWRRLAARSQATRVVALALAAALLARWVFMAARSDWHGGFCLGPRYLLMAVPFALLPAVAWLDALVEAGRRRALAAACAFVWACALQQLYFVLGEIFSYLHVEKLRGALAGHNVFDEDEIFLSAGLSPLSGLLDGARGPFLFKRLTIGNWTLWLLGAVLLSIGWYLAARSALASVPAPRDQGGPGSSPSRRGARGGSGQAGRRKKSRA
jgi:hypothetical protein